MAEREFPDIGQPKLEEARLYLLDQDLITQVRVTQNPLEITADSAEMLDPEGAREIMENALIGMGFRFDIREEPLEGDHLSYVSNRKTYLANAIFAHGSPGDEGIGVSVRWVKRLSPKEYEEMTL
jgi:hypothetical protein